MMNLLQAFGRQKYARVLGESLLEAERLLPQALANCPANYRLSLPTIASVRAATAAGWQLDWAGYFPLWEAQTKRFGCALYSQDELCGLALGKINDSGRILNIVMMEGTPLAAHPFKGHVLDTVELVGIICAQKVGASEIRLINPIAGVVPYYQRMGYKLQTGSPTYCAKQVTL